MEEQIITVHVPKDQYRKFAKLAGQVNVPMQTILSQFVLDCVSDRWDSRGNHGKRLVRKSLVECF